MRIAYLSRGHSVYDRRFLEKLVERGHKVFFISYFPAEKVQVPGVTALHYDVSSIVRFRYLASLQIAWHLRKLLNEIKPDVLHTGWIQDHGFYGALSGFRPMLSMPWGSDVLIRPHDSAFTKWITWFTLKQANKITCDCELVKQEIMRLSGCPPDKIAVFPWGIDLNIFKPMEGKSQIRQQLGWEDNLVIIATRSFEPIYGLEYLFAALTTVIASRPEARIILVGNGSLRAEYEAKVTKLGLKDKIYFSGFVDNKRMADLLRASDIYVTTSLSDGTSCSMLEAMAIGLPVVVSDAPAYFEWVKEGLNGYIVPRRDSLRLVERLLYLLSKPDLRREMGRYNQELARARADWEKNFNQLESIFLSLVVKKRR